MLSRLTFLKFDLLKKSLRAVMVSLRTIITPITRLHIHRLDRILLYLALILLGTGLIFNLVVKKAAGLGNTTLVFTQWWQDELEEGTLSSLAGEFERQNPGITIRLDNRSYAEVRDALIRVPDGSPLPDIIALDPLWLDALIQHDIPEPLAAYGGDSAPFAADMAEGRNEQWGLPLVSFINPFFYNIKLLQDAGLDRPPKTYAELLACARAVTDRSRGRFALALSLGPENPQGIFQDLFSWIWASSGDITGNTGKLDFTAQPVVETLRFLDQLHREELIMPGIFSGTRDEKIAKFTQGHIGMMIGSVSDIQTIRMQMDDSAFGITTIPAGAGYTGKPILGLSSWYLGLSRQGKHKEEAWAFLSFLLERESLIAARAHAIPGSGNIINTFGEDPLYSKVYDIYAAGEIRPYTSLPRSADLSAIVREEVYAMFEEGRSPEETARAIQRRWEESEEGREDDEG
jgi:multiple sugar transport system substrate-binding protein